MAWGKSKTTAPPSALIQILPLVITLAFLAGLGWIGYQIFLSLGKIKTQAKEQMGKKDVVFTRDGLRVGVKQVQNEDYVDRTQSWVVKAWNLSGEAAKEEGKKKKK